MVYNVIQSIWCELHAFDVLGMDDVAIFSMEEGATFAIFKYRFESWVIALT